MSHTTRALALSAALTLLTGCPLLGGENNDENNTPRPDASPGEDAGADAGADAGGEDAGGEDAGEDAGGAELTCVDPWPSVKTLPRAAGPQPLELLTLCRGISVEDVSALESTATYTGAPGEDAQTLTATSVVGERFGEGDWVLVAMNYDLPEASQRATRPKLEPIILNDGAVNELAPVELRTHLSEGELATLHEGKLLASAEASALASENPVFVSTEGASTNVLASKPGGGSSVFGTAYDQRTSMLKLEETPLGGGAPAARGEFDFGRVDHAALKWAKNGDGGARLFVIAQCLDVRAVPCGSPLNFGRALINEGGEVVLTESTGDVSTLAELPPAIFTDAAGRPTTLIYTELVKANDGGAKPRVLYAAQDPVKNEQIWVVVDAFDYSSTRTPRVRRVATQPDIGGVTPRMVADGEATVGLIRSPDAQTLDPEELVDESNLLVWVAKEAPGGGTTFSMPFEDRFQDVTFDDVDPGTAAAHAVYWGSEGERAIVFTGVNARRVPTDHIGAFNWRVEIDSVHYRPLDVPGAPLPVGALGQDVVVGGEGSEAGTSRFAVVIGLNNTKKEPASPLDALLDDTDAAAVVFEGGGDLAGDTPYGSKGTLPLVMADGPDARGVAWARANGVAVLEAIDTLQCEGADASCDIPLAATARGATVYEDGKQPGEWTGSGMIMRAAGDDAGTRLFTSNPGYAFLMTRRAMAFDTSSAEGPGHAVVVPFGREDGSQGLHLVELGEDGQVRSSGELVVQSDGGEAIPTQDATLLAFDGEAGVLAYRDGGGWSLGQFARAAGNGSGSVGVTITATIEVVYQDAGQQLNVPRTCPMHHPSCALASARFGARAVKTYRFGQGLEGDALDAEVAAVQAFASSPTPAVIAVGQYETGTACGLATLLYTSLDAEPVVVSTSEERDCSDLAIPVATGDILGEGGQEFMLLRRTSTGGVVSVAYLGEDLEGTPSLRHKDLGEVGAAVDVSTPGAARAVVVSDINDDGLPDVSFDPNIGGGDLVFTDAAQLDVFHTTHGGTITVEGQVRVPGLEVHGARGERGRVGGVQHRGGRWTHVLVSHRAGKMSLR